MKDNIDLFVEYKINSFKKSNLKMEDIFNSVFEYDERIALEYSENDKIIKVSYGECKKEILSFYEGFSNLFPNLKDQYIALDLENSYEWIVGFWGILMSGNKPYLVNKLHPLQITLDNFKTLNIKYYVGKKENYDDLNFININEIYGEYSGKPYEFANELALGTSATTLKNKICIYDGERLSNQILNSEDIMKKNKLIKRHYKGELKLLAFIPFAHIFGLIATYLWFSFFNRTMVFLPNLDSKNIIKTIKTHEVTHIFSVPLFYETIAKEIDKEINKRDEKIKNKFNKGLKISYNIQKMSPIKGMKFSRKLFKEINDKIFGDSVQFLISGGGYIKDSTLKLINLLGYPLYNGYGTTEVGITSVDLNIKIDKRLKNSVGKPFKNVEYIIDNNILKVKSSSSCRSIFINSIKEEPDEIYDTKDIAKIDKDGDYYILGRNSDLVIQEDGENINPDEIEKQLTFNSVFEFSVLGLKQNDKELLSIIIVISKYINKEKIEGILSSISSYNDKVTFPFKIKNILFTYDEIKNKNAIKVSRVYLKELINNNKIKLFKANELIEENLIDYKLDDNIKNTVFDIIADVLNISKDKIELNQNIIFDLGATSLDYISIICRINEEFEIELKINESSDTYTIENLIKKVEASL